MSIWRKYSTLVESLGSVTFANFAPKRSMGGPGGDWRGADFSSWPTGDWHCSTPSAVQPTPASAKPAPEPSSNALWTERYNVLQQQLRCAETARMAAETASAQKTKLLAAASHDLRQPVQALSLLLEYLNTTELTALQHKVLDRAQAACSDSRNLLNSLLDYSRLEAGAIVVRPTPVSMQALLNELELAFAPMAEAKGLLFRVHESPLVAMADFSLLSQVLRNLVSNAIKFTGCGGVLIACRQRHDAVMLEVWDTGIGIDSAHQQDIFEEFKQCYDPSVALGQEKGVGLGLAIVDRLTRLMKAKLSLRSELGRGSVFRLTLPRCSNTLGASGVGRTVNAQSPAVVH